MIAERRRPFPGARGREHASPLARLVVLSWNGLDHLRTCLPSLRNQTYPNMEIILVDNGSTDGTSTWVAQEFPEVSIARLESNRGVPGGINFGITRARGDYVALVNNDTEFEPQWLEASIDALQRHADAGFTASRIRLFYHRSRLDTAGDIYFTTGHVAKRGWLQSDGPQYSSEAWVFGSSGAAAVYRRALLDDIGLYDEDFQAGIEDLDISFRAQLAGYRCLYVPQAIVYHKVGATLGAKRASAEQLYRIHRNLWVTRLKNLPWQLWLRYLGPMIFAEALVLAAALRGGRLGILVRARWGVLRELGYTLAKRRVIQAKRRVSLRYLDSIISKGWLSDRLDTRRREANVDIRAN